MRQVVVVDSYIGRLASGPWQEKRKQDYLEIEARCCCIACKIGFIRRAACLRAMAGEAQATPSRYRGKPCKTGFMQGLACLGAMAGEVQASPSRGRNGEFPLMSFH